MLALNSPRGVFTAELAGGAQDIPDLEEGCTVDVSGVCLVSTDGSGNPASFKIMIPGPAQVKVVERASFFTAKRLLIMLCVTLGGLAAALVFAYFISRRSLRDARAQRGDRGAQPLGARPARCICGKSPGAGAG